jgi:hypothetical protein
MLSLSIGSVDVSAKCTQYTEDVIKVKDNDNSFISVSGNRHNVYLSTKRTLNIKLENLTTAERDNIISAMGTSFSVTYNGATGTFNCESIPSELFYAGNYNLWDCNFTIEEV